MCEPSNRRTGANPLRAARIPGTPPGRLPAVALAALALAATGGCAVLAPEPHGKLFERDGVSMVVVPSAARETYFSDARSLERHCRAPSPDVSVTASEGVSLSAPLPSPAGAGSVGASEDATRGALSLGGRDPAVLITRELMYRACELASNLKLDTAQTLKLYQDTLAAILKVTASQTGAGSAALAATPADTRVSAPAAPATGTSTDSPGGSSGDGT